MDIRLSTIGKFVACVKNNCIYVTMYLHVYPYDFCVCITILNNRLQYNVHMHGINVCRHTVTELSQFVDKYNFNSRD